MLFGEANDGGDGHSTLTVILTAVGGLITAVATGLATAWGMLRKGRADVHRQEVDTHAKEIEVSVEEARERTKLRQDEEERAVKLRQDEEAWAVKEARQMYRDLKKQTDSLWQEARDCHLRLATYIARDRDREARIRELEERLGMPPRAAKTPSADDIDLDQWADQVRGDAQRDAQRRKDGQHDDA